MSGWLKVAEMNEYYYLQCLKLFNMRLKDIIVVAFVCSIEALLFRNH